MTHLGRRLAAVVLVFALLLQSMAVAARLTTGSAGDTSLAGFELCKHDAGSESPSGDPAQRSADQEHCLLCLAATAYVLGPSVPTPVFRTIAFAIVQWPCEAWRLPP